MSATPGRFGRGPSGPTVCMSRYAVIAPGEPGNDTQRWRVADARQYAKALETGRHTYMAASFASETDARARAESLNRPLYPPTAGPEGPFPPVVSATPDELSAAAHYAALDQAKRPAVFDLPTVRTPHHYAAVLRVPTDEESQ